MWKCLECGRKFKTAKAATKAANDGCPECDGVDIDLDVAGTPTEDTWEATDHPPATMTMPVAESRTTPPWRSLRSAGWSPDPPPIQNRT